MLLKSMLPKYWSWEKWWWTKCHRLGPLFKKNHKNTHRVNSLHTSCARNAEFNTKNIQHVFRCKLPLLCSCK